MCPDIMSTGFGGAESGRIRIGDTRGGVRAGADRPLRHRRREADGRDHGSSPSTAVPERLAMARRLGADHVVDFSKADPVEAILRLTDGRGVDVAIEALGTQATFEARCACCGPGGTLSEPRRLLDRPAASRSTPSPPASATTASSPRSAPAARSGCGRLMAVIASRPGGPAAAGHPPLPAGGHRARPTSCSATARRRAEGGDHAVTGRGAPLPFCPSPAFGVSRPREQQPSSTPQALDQPSTQLDTLLRMASAIEAPPLPCAVVHPCDAASLGGALEAAAARADRCRSWSGPAAQDPRCRGRQPGSTSPTCL